MKDQQNRAHQFKDLHKKGEPLILYNIWDAGSAKAVQQAGAKAIATGSWSVAAAYGYADGEKLPLELAISNAKRIVDSVDLPVSLDFEGGYSESPAGLKETVAQVIRTGVIGINFEDRIVQGKGLYAVDVQSARIKAIRETAEKLSIPFFINARTDLFLSDPAGHNDALLEETLQRAAAYTEAGASGIFVPGIRNTSYIKTICESVRLPVNILMMANMPEIKELAGLGVARISYGPMPYRQMMEFLKESAAKIFK